jgi:hypothetical protein
MSQDLRPANPRAPPQRQRQPRTQSRVDRWPSDEQEAPGTSGSERRMYEEWSTAGFRGKDKVTHSVRESRERWFLDPYPSEGAYNSASDPLVNGQGLQDFMADATSRRDGNMHATFPRSEQERAEWEARGWGREDFGGLIGRPGPADNEDFEWGQPGAGGPGGVPVRGEQTFERTLSASIAKRWSEQTSREERLSGEGKGQVGRSTSPGSIASIEERVSKVGYVAENEQIWVEESRVSLEALMQSKPEQAPNPALDQEPQAGEEKAADNDGSPTRVAEAVARMALTSVGWDEAMHNFHDLREVKAVVKKPEELMSPASVGGGVTLSGLARKRTVSMPAAQGEVKVRVSAAGGAAEVRVSASGLKGAVPQKGPGGSYDSVLQRASSGSYAEDQSTPDARPKLEDGGPSSEDGKGGGGNASEAPDASDRCDAAVLQRRSEDDVSKGGGQWGQPRGSYEGQSTREVPSLPISVAAIISPPSLPGCTRPPILRSDSYPPSEVAPGRASPTWSTAITSVPILSVHPPSSGPIFRPEETLPPRLAPKPLLGPGSQLSPSPETLLEQWVESGQSEDSRPLSQPRVPFPPSTSNPRLPLRRASRQGLLSPEEKRYHTPTPPPARSPLPQHDGGRVQPKKSWRGELSTENALDTGVRETMSDDEAWAGARAREAPFQSVSRRDDAAQNSRTRFAPPLRGEGGRVDDAAHSSDLEGTSALVVEEDCAICNERLQVGRALFAPECGHFVHFDCCRSNLLKGSLDCPRCYQRMQEKPYLKTPYLPPQSVPHHQRSGSAPSGWGSQG